MIKHWEYTECQITGSKIAYDLLLSHSIDWIEIPRCKFLLHYWDIWYRILFIPLISCTWKILSITFVQNKDQPIAGEGSSNIKLLSRNTFEIWFWIGGTKKTWYYNYDRTVKTEVFLFKRGKKKWSKEHSEFTNRGKEGKTRNIQDCQRSPLKYFFPSSNVISIFFLSSLLQRKR